MHRTSSLLTLLLVAVASLSGCGQQEQQRPASTSISAAKAPPPRRAQPLAMPAADYVARAGVIDLYEIAAAEVALRRSGSGSVRDFAAMMIRAHKGTSSQLSFAGRRLNLLPARTLSPKYETMMEQLRSAQSFDAAYKSQQLTAHREALAIHSAYATRGSSPTLRPVASAAVPIIQRHLRLLRYL